jgi:hypothetical protein
VPSNISNLQLGQIPITGFATSEFLIYLIVILGFVVVADGLFGFGWPPSSAWAFRFFSDMVYSIAQLCRKKFTDARTVVRDKKVGGVGEAQGQLKVSSRWGDVFTY